MSGFTVTGLTDYVSENADDIATAAILGADTLQMPGIHILEGIKNSHQLMNFDGTAPFQTGGTCAFNASGSSTFTDRQVTVTKLKWNDTWCPEDLENKFLSTKLPAGSNYDSLPFEGLIIGEVTQNIAAQLEQTIWQGDTTNHVFDPNLKQFNGWLSVIDGEATVVDADTTAEVTTSNVESIFDDIYQKIPAQLLNHPTKKMVAMTGWDVFRKLIIAYKDSNFFHFEPAKAFATGELVMPGTGLKVKALNGLNNITGTTSDYKDRIICTYASNLVYATDLKNEYGDEILWYSQDDQNVKGSIKWKSGVQVRRPEEIVSYKNS
jgi:hypothetical protein